MVSEKFRYQLRQEVEKWQAEGLIDLELSNQLASRYQFADLDTSARNRFVVILVGLGSILLGLAVITFVAANWQIWSKEIKVLLLLGLFTIINTTGFALWRQRGNNWRSRLGLGLLLLGGLLLGANLGLMSQIFHQTGSIYELFLVWGFGVLIMAYSLRLTPLGIVAIILTAIGYYSGFYKLFSYSDNSIFQFSLEHTPILASILFISLAYWCNSRWLFGLGTVLVVSSLEINLLSLFPALNSNIVVLAITVPPALLWAYQDKFWSINSSETNNFAPIAQNLAITFLAILFYFFSFQFFWDNPPSNLETNWLWHDILPLIDALLLLGLTLWQWWHLIWRSRQIDLTSSVLIVMIIATGTLFWWHLNIETLGAIATITINVFLALLAVGLIREALGTGKRRGFWSGVILLVLQITSRMLEYNTGLLFKAIVLFLCGIGIIMGGLWFERYLRTLNPS